MILFFTTSYLRLVLLTDICSTHFFPTFLVGVVHFRGISCKFGQAWFIFWQDAVQPKYPQRDQTSLMCCQNVSKSYYPNAAQNLVIPGR